MGAAGEDAVLDGDGGEVAGAHADEREPVGSGRLGRRGHLAPAALRRPQPPGRGVQELFPRLGAHGVAEQRVIAAAGQPIASAVLLVGPPARQVGDAVDVVVDDGPAVERRTDEAVAPAAQHVEERLQPAGGRGEVFDFGHGATGFWWAGRAMALDAFENACPGVPVARYFSGGVRPRRARTPFGTEGRPAGQAPPTPRGWLPSSFSSLTDREWSVASRR